MEFGGNAGPTQERTQDHEPPKLELLPKLTTIKPQSGELKVWGALRPIPEDVLPCIGFVRPGCYVALSHSGVTPLIGALAATEINLGLDLELLSQYRQTRF